MSDSKSHDGSMGEKSSDIQDNVKEVGSEIDLLDYHEHNAGRLVVDPEEARIEFGEAVAKKLKLSKDGTKVLWPQPADDPLDPQNWSDFQKNLQLFIITLAAIVPDFDSGIGKCLCFDDAGRNADRLVQLGIASIFALAKQFDTTTGVINNLTSNWSIFLLGWGGLFAVMLMRRFGRLPVLFWSQLIAVSFLVGCTFAPNLKTFTAMRCLNGFFATCPQVTGLYIVTDLFPFHLQARKLNIWTMGFIISPFLSPFAFGFLVARASWRWAYGIGSLYGACVLLLIVLFSKETMYDRKLPNPRPVPISPNPIRARIEALTGVTGLQMAKYRSSWKEVVTGEISALVNLFRTLGGFAVAYFQVPWATKHGALQTFGCEAAIVAGMFVLIVPALQVMGRVLRERYSL
ncbi:hypothetical protein EIP86_005220 [Pleurotus ostreatoroseus]|nr:hypothetical protein EIP86_005220 [Pleurotus ostreatoroseus]